MIREPKTILTTERLILRTWQESDVMLMTQISSDPEVMAHFPATQDYAATQGLVQRVQAHYLKWGYGLYAVEIRATGEFIGFVGLSQPSFEIPGFEPNGLPIVEIGWRLAKQHWGKGYAPEAANAVLEYGFTVLALPEIISFTVVANSPSRRVMEKIGLHHDAVDDFKHPNIAEDNSLCHHVLYRLTRDAYLQRRNKQPSS